jgi:hypothetical protein
VIRFLEILKPWPLRLTTQRMPERKDVQRNGPTLMAWP